MQTKPKTSDRKGNRATEGTTATAPNPTLRRCGHVPRQMARPNQPLATPETAKSDIVDPIDGGIAAQQREIETIRRQRDVLKAVYAVCEPSGDLETEFALLDAELAYLTSQRDIFVEAAEVIFDAFRHEARE